MYIFMTILKRLLLLVKTVFCVGGSKHRCDIHIYDTCIVSQRKFSGPKEMLANFKSYD